MSPPPYTNTYTHKNAHARAHTNTGIYKLLLLLLSFFVRISDELLYKLDYLVHSVATKYVESFEMWCCRMMEKISWN